MLSSTICQACSQKLNEIQEFKKRLQPNQEYLAKLFNENCLDNEDLEADVIGDTEIQIELTTSASSVDNLRTERKVSKSSKARKQRSPSLLNDATNE